MKLIARNAYNPIIQKNNKGYQIAFIRHVNKQDILVVKNYTIENTNMLAVDVDILSNNEYIGVYYCDEDFFYYGVVNVLTPMTIQRIILVDINYNKSFIHEYATGDLIHIDNTIISVRYTSEKECFHIWA